MIERRDIFMNKVVIRKYYTRERSGTVVLDRINIHRPGEDVEGEEYGRWAIRIVRAIWKRKTQRPYRTWLAWNGLNIELKKDIYD
jgi:hypothetical protein